MPRRPLRYAVAPLWIVFQLCVKRGTGSISLDFDALDSKGKFVIPRQEGVHQLVSNVYISNSAGDNVMFES